MVKKINEFKELQKKKGKKGFSMIELIIVLAIMAILVALIGTQLIPYLEKSREKRDKTTLDTCKTALESVIADHEFDTKSLGSTTIGDVLTAIDAADSNADAPSEFQAYAGIATSATPFKSQDAGTSTGVAAVAVVFDTNGVITQVSASSLDLIE